MTITIRDVPDETRQALADRARTEGKSLQSYLLAVLEQEAGFQRNRQILEWAEERARVRDSAVTGGDIAEIIRQGREQRSAQIRGAASEENRGP
ncbi:hypothetical protein GCM10009583_15490 [Ornithinicoccus hortensis]|uniref:Antitoxin FitA-like ribbon-helix-helix domain-containing protein n=1 Tax=Ornithinicoccus hortensis TaxID=82346 RepID=A0A542YNV1_9MICO|nr:hypothetical protein FB467_0872 [Ornithinicoccus hortensis]